MSEKDFWDKAVDFKDGRGYNTLVLKVRCKTKIWEVLHETAAYRALSAHAAE